MKFIFFIYLSSFLSLALLAAEDSGQTTPPEHTAPEPNPWLNFKSFRSQDSSPAFYRRTGGSFSNEESCKRRSKGECEKCGRRYMLKCREGYKARGCFACIKDSAQ